MPDLEESNSISLRLLTDLELWSVPKLAYARSVFLTVPSHLVKLDFPMLNSTRRINIEGNMTDVSFDLLETIDGEVMISNTVWNLEPAKPGGPSMNLSFPALESAFGLRFWGNISSISLPNLSRLGPSTSDYNALPSLFSNSGLPMPLDLPNLSFVQGDLGIEGNISSLSLPRFKHITQWLSVSSKVPLAIDLPLESATQIELSGQIESISLPNLRNWTKLRVQTSLPFDCDAFINKFNGTESEPAPGEVDCKATGRRQSQEDRGNMATRRLADMGFALAAAITGIVLVQAGC
ncbi:hypothetical protein BDW74DRAFT_179220 [Aspergillus multicolor]|uniref:uncharacterized protein n=1 Tax=Aspergillus multicolor TaxID=41759 RepID=UPI003CCDF7DB